MRVVDRKGIEHEISTEVGGVLMEALRDLDYGVAAVCGGACSCATCHVYIDPDWREIVQGQLPDEWELVSELQHRRENSRLSCQVPLSAMLDGMRVTLAQEE